MAVICCTEAVVQYHQELAPPPVTLYTIRGFDGCMGVFYLM